MSGQAFAMWCYNYGNKEIVQVNIFFLLADLQNMQYSPLKLDIDTFKFLHMTTYIYINTF